MGLYQLSVGLTVIVAVAFHLGVLRALHHIIPRLGFLRHARIGFLILIAIAGHLVEVGMFAGTMYAWAHEGSFGQLGAEQPNDFGDYYYFSIVTYTSLGYGDLTPVGRMRLLAGIEALTGIILVAWTSSHLFLLMQRYWERDPGR